MLSLQKSVGGPQPFDTRARWRVADGRHDSQRGKFRQTWARTPNSFPGCFEWKWMTVVRASQKVLRPRCAQNPLALDHEQGVEVCQPSHSGVFRAMNCLNWWTGFTSCQPQVHQFILTGLGIGRFASQLSGRCHVVQFATEALGGGETGRSSTVEIWNAESAHWRWGPELRQGTD